MFSRVRSSRTGDPRVLRCTLDALARRRNAELDEDLEANPRRDDVSLLRIRVWGSLRVVDDSGLRVKMCVWLGVSRGLDLAFLNAD